MSVNFEALEGVERISNTITFALEQALNSNEIAEMKDRAHNILILLYPSMSERERSMWIIEQRDLFAEFVLVAHVLKRTGIIDVRQRSHIYAVILSKIYCSTIELTRIYARVLNCMLSAYMNDDELVLFDTIGTATHKNLTLAYRVMRRNGFLIGRT